MEKLPKYTLGYDKEKEKWTLEHDATDRVLRNFETKSEATKGGVLKQILGADGGSVKIKKQNGRIEEERTYPRSRDPRKSKG